MRVCVCRCDSGNARVRQITAVATGDPCTTKTTRAATTTVAAASRATAQRERANKLKAKAQVEKRKSAKKAVAIVSSELQ